MTGIDAVRAAGYTGKDATLRVAASKLMAKAKIQDAIAELSERALDAADAPEDPELAPKHRAFVDALLGGKSAAAAARVAGYGVRSAAKAADRLLRRADVRAALEAGRAKREAAAVADVREQQVMLSAIARNEKAHPDTRIKAILALHRIQTGAAARPPLVSPSGPRPPLFVVVDNGRGPRTA